MKIVIYSLLLIIPFFAKAQSQTFTAVADAQVYEGSKTNNYGTSVNLQLKKIPESANSRISYLKFDLSSYTLSQTGKAVLRVYLNKHENFQIPVIVEAMNVTDNNWSESTLNWNNKPTPAGSIATAQLNAVGMYYEWDVSEYIRSLNLTVGNGNLVSLALQDVAGSEALLTFNSKEATTNKPQLVIYEAYSSPMVGGTFYVDAVNGNDLNAGTSTVAAWKTLDMVNSKVFQPGSKILFKSGQTFYGTLLISGSGNGTSTISYETYGGTSPAVIDAQGTKTAAYAYNKSYIEIKNLAFTNYRNGTITEEDLFHAMLWINENAGTLNHIYLDELRIFNVNSSDVADAAGTKNHGGIFFDILGTSVISKWNDLQVTNCTFENLSRTGINFESTWELRNSTTSFGDNLGDGRTDNWVPSTNVILRGNTFRHIAGNGLVVRVAVNPLIEYNYFEYCGETISGNAAFNFNTDGAIFQFNEATKTVYNDGDTDARGIDSDFRTKDTYIQYNYLHHNGLGGVVATGGDQNVSPPSIPERFNVNTVIRYNILENNERQAISFSGGMKSAEVYNNTIYADATVNNVLAVRLAIWSVAPKNISFKNNIFYLRGSNTTYSFASGSTYSFNNNIFYTTSSASEPSDPNKRTADPLLLNPASGLEGFKLKPSSPALNTGMNITSNGGRDYFGNAVPVNGSTNIGAYSGAGTNVLPIELSYFKAEKTVSAVLLRWATATEINNEHFEIERAVDGSSFTKIASVKSKGDSKNITTYSYEDRGVSVGTYYYRLKQVDFDGKYTYSDIETVNFKIVAENQLMVYPNPVGNYFKLNVKGDFILSIYDMQGKIVLQRQLANYDANQIDVQHLKTGLYLIKVHREKDNEFFQSRFMKF
ncbi:CBM96 family carbohydrate-binding protein [Nubsella zeaxanthinifaciens]|uniref:CBM96 family carbohydrate-binding protein n=1 Tax=Nubsella zeaxanthinifaciens TaxID=392412 RepID=UPI000DE320F8|nr:DNRLRE domain-containing protein [Nubsella zeaxanthinifaciens]